MRKNQTERKTRETRVEVSLDLDGIGEYEVNTGIGFFNHMLETFSRHSLIDLTVNASGDIHVDYHHLVEDSGITIGKSIRTALGEMKGVRRFGEARVPLDEALVSATVDISGRPGIFSNLNRRSGKIADFNFELAEVFFVGFASQGYTCHIDIIKGDNLHHIIEASFKAFARAIRQAVELDERRGDSLPSTKDYIER